MEGLEAKAAELFAAGKSVNAVAKELGISWLDAKKLKGGEAVPAAGGGKRKKRKKKASRRVSKPASQPEQEEPAAWDLNVQVEAGRVDDLLATFTIEEKCTAIARVLQLRVDAALG
jgi:hypothetical protein